MWIPSTRMESTESKMVNPLPHPVTTLLRLNTALVTERLEKNLGQPENNRHVIHANQPSQQGTFDNLSASPETMRATFNSQTAISMRTNTPLLPGSDNQSPKPDKLAILNTIFKRNPMDREISAQDDEEDGLSDIVELIA